MILVLVGPTGVGKSEVALELARRLPAEIVSADSMQVYRGMDLGTGKPDPAVRQEIPHHGLDLVEPEEEFDVARYLRQIAPVIEEILDRGRMPILVGGSGLYVKRLMDGLCRAPGGDPKIRQQLFARGHQEGAAKVHQQLTEVDPEAASRIHPNDLKRIVRALEVFLITGRPMSDWQSQTTHSPFKDQEAVWIGLTSPREALHARIESRIDGWLSNGWLEEARALHRRALSRTARLCLGYKELFAHLEGKADWAATVLTIKQNTRRYARRQWIWFKADPRIRWIDVHGKSPQTLAQEILAAIPCHAI